MGRKKIGIVSQAQETFELRIFFCYYCDKEFDSTKTLITHQRTKHFNCAECGLKFDTVTGLRVHMLNAYKKTMKEVPKAMPGRENPDIVVHGMEGLPKGLLDERTQKAKAEKAKQDRQKEEENRERLKRVAEAQAASVPPEAKRRTISPVPEVPPPPQMPLPVPLVSSPRPPPQAMPGLSLAVASLLSGAESSRLGPPMVPGLVNHSVPPALNGLHPVALQVLAFAGALPPKSVGSMQPALALLGSALAGTVPVPTMVHVGPMGM